VALNSLTEIGVQRLTNGKQAWINVSREFVLDGYPRLLPPQQFVLELLEHQLLDAELIDELRALAEAGYRIALDDAVLDELTEELLEMASYVKLDLPLLGRERFAEDVAHLRHRQLEILAEKVETHEEHSFTAALGCRLFQGYFFARPQTVVRRHVDTDRTSVLQLMSTLSKPVVEISEIAAAIVREPHLSYRLLRYINSAFFGFSQRIDSITQAVMLLGVGPLRRWSALNLYLTAGHNSVELARLALTRARFVELSSSRIRPRGADQMFMVGLMSVLDALLGMPLEQSLKELPLSAQITAAVLGASGPGSDQLASVRALEQGDLVTAKRLVADADEFYLQALLWADQMLQVQTDAAPVAG
jgi:EAL and modified HD-GYP domain-containing signal transduction protein